MLKTLLYLIIFASLSFNCVASEASSDNHKGLLIFLDDSEFFETTRVKALYADLISAIGQKAGPILVSGNLLATISSRYTANLKTETDWAGKHLRAMIYQRPTSYDQHDLLLKASEFNPEEWIIKNINDYIYLLIPTSYVTNSGFKLTDFNVSISSPNATSLELATGLKVNHMRSVALESIVHKMTNKDYFQEALFNAATNSSKIFCLNVDYAKQTVIKKPIWAIYIIGHGSIGSLITNLSIESFKKFLDFLTKKIITSLLVYVSCYAAGLNEQMIYSDAESAVQKTYPYAIITKALTDAPTNVSRSSAERVITTDFLDNKVTFRHTYTNFIDFFDAIKNSPYDYKNIALKLFHSLVPTGRLSNTSQIKLPGVEWFSTVASNKQIFSIGNNLAKLRTAPLKISKFTQSNPKVILLYSSHVPFELILDSTELEAIISMIPGNAIHHIEKIKSNKNLMEILNLFSNIADLGVSKKFIIHEIEIINSFDKPSQIAKNIIVYNDASQWKTMLFLNGEIYSYHKNSPYPYTQASSGELSIYGRVLREGQKTKNEFIISELQNINLVDFFKRKSQQNDLLIEELFQLQNELRLLD